MQRRRRMFLSGLAALFGGVALVMGLKLYGEAKRTREWPTVPGRIIERGVGKTVGTGRSRAIVVKYGYTVAGKEYQSDRVHPMGEVGFLDAQEKVDALPDPVPVHYDPADPSRSYLLPLPMVTVWIALVFGALVLPIALLSLLVQLAQR